jgi:hypothetical protein
MHWTRRPVVHFVLIGGLLFAGRGWWHERTTPPEPRVPAPIFLTAEKVERLRAEFAAKTGAMPIPAEERALIEAEIDDELLYREAIALGLDRNDRSIRHYLAENLRFVLDGAEAADEAALERQAIDWGLDRTDRVVRRMLIDKMRLLATRATGDGEPSEDDLEVYLARNAERYRKPARVSLTHVFFSAAIEQASSRARDARRRLESRLSGAAQAMNLGDPFPLGARFTAKSERDLAKLFGAEFAARVMRLETGVWSEEIASPFGLHLVRVDEKRSASLPSLAEVRSRVALAVEAERRRGRLNELLGRLRAITPVQIAGAGRPASGGVQLARQAAERIAE